ncbi:carbohydrate-binding protein SusD [Niabella ginsenosidivorans]|uniref:Carbohydrate-binding protein SusD n=1 Tax=Niabella ginsenosidivorans TaxID=1176587 RepID=A0A1A9I855_9BACT|nr:RagB/SusD family nutrient uptake outer membrane protein [Niabella ginsenosidivorans]ANH82880.1 carbohydrate-binding protein SusD [Niabella ginsenosidivorans]
MKKLLYTTLSVIFSIFIFSCNKIIDIDPISNVGAGAFYKNYNEVNTALAGCYNGMQGPLYNEWMFTDLRSDNSLQGVPNTSSVDNIELNDLDMFTLNATHSDVYDYWLAAYKNIRAVNYVLGSLGVTFSNGQDNFGTATAQLNDDQKKQLAGEALIVRAYHYFNLVRLFGGVFLISEPEDPQTSKKVGRSSATDIYNFIMADLNTAQSILPRISYSQIAATDLGRVNIWSAKALLAKVYLTLGRKADALMLLDDIITNSGYGLLPSYADVFSVSNEMNREIIFAVRYKAGGFNLGSPFANLFAPTGSGSAIVAGDGKGYNFPTTSIQAAFKTSTSSGSDARKDVTVAVYNTTKPYVKKFLSTVAVSYDAENDFPVIRFSDVLLMKAEAVGFDGPSGVAVGIINQVRQRAGAIDYTGTGDFSAGFYKYPSGGDSAINSASGFTKALLNERRLEFAFENQRFFDMQRLGDAVQMIKDHFAEEYDVFYSRISPKIPLETLQGNVTKDKLLLPIPQREIDTNNEIPIEQNTGY